MARRLGEWAAFGVASTYAGWNLVVKNSVLAMAWYTIEAQLIEGADAMLTNWQKMAWRFIEASSDALRCSATTPSPTAHKVSRAVLAQDYAEGPC
jgi:hypothetical protein